MAQNQQLIQAEQFIRAQFINLGFFPEFIVSQISMLKILDTMSHQQFDREIAHELFNQCEVSFKGDIQIENFVVVLLQANTLLDEKIELSIQSILEYSKKRQEAQYQLKQAEQNKAANKGSKLVIQIIEATHLYQGETNASFRPYVVLYCGSDKQSTKIAQNDKFNPIWQQTFTFDIHTGDEKTYASVLSLEANNQPKLLGEAHFSLFELQDQYKRTIWFDLYERMGQKAYGQLHLELQYISDQTQFYQDSLANIDKYLVDLQAEKTQYLSDLKALYIPFSKANLLKPELNVTITAPNLMFIDELTRPSVYKNGKKIDLLNFRNTCLSDIEVNTLLGHKMDDQIVDANDKYPAQQDLLQKLNYGFLHPDRDIYICAILMIIFMIFSLFNCFLRTDFISVTLAFLCFQTIGLNYFQKPFLNFMSIFLLLSSIADCVWLSTNENYWWHDKHYYPQGSDPLRRYSHISIPIVYITMIIKIILSLAFFKIQNVAGYLNNKNQFGLGSYLYNFEGGSINPFTKSLQK